MPSDFKEDIYNQIDNFYLDITNTIINDKVYDINLQDNKTFFWEEKKGYLQLLI